MIPGLKSMRPRLVNNIEGRRLKYEFGLHTSDFILKFKCMFFNKEKFNKKEILKWGVGAGLAEVVYVILVGLCMSSLDKVMSNPQPIVLGIFSVLILLVISAGISGLLVFGYPAYLALQKQYKEALWTICATFATIILSFILGVSLIILFFNN